MPLFLKLFPTTSKNQFNKDSKSEQISNNKNNFNFKKSKKLLNSNSQNYDSNKMIKRIGNSNQNNQIIDPSKRIIIEESGNQNIKISNFTKLLDNDPNYCILINKENQENFTEKLPSISNHISSKHSITSDLTNGVIKVEKNHESTPYIYSNANCLNSLDSSNFTRISDKYTEKRYNKKIQNIIAKKKAKNREDIIYQSPINIMNNNINVNYQINGLKTLDYSINPIENQFIPKLERSIAHLNNEIIENSEMSSEK